MKVSTIAPPYEKRLNRVVDYIHDHLEEELNLNRLAEVACLSAYHWHRIYSAVRGETVMATVRRLRLQRAADRLANSDMAIDEITRRAGYGTVESFGRAFKQDYGQPPASYRANGSHARYKAATRDGSTASFPVTLEQHEPLSCACVAHAGGYMAIDRAMGTLFNGLAAQNLLQEKPRMLAVFFDDPEIVEESELRSMACSPVPMGVSSEAPLERRALRGGCYARVRYEGPYADMKEAYRWMFGVWLPQSGHEPADAPVIEEYLNSPVDTPQTKLLTDILVPLGD